MIEERKFFMQHVEDLRMHMIFFQRSVKYYKDMFMIDADFTVDSAVKLLDDQIDRLGYERLKVCS